MATTDFVVKNGLVVTDAADILSISDAASSSDTAASIYTAGGVAVAKKAYVGTDLAVGGATTLTGDIAVNGGDITTSSATFNLINAAATTVNFAGAATTLEIGAATGTTNINNNLDVDGDVNIDGGDLTVSTTTFNLANTTATTGNLFGAATAVNIGTATGTLTIGNPTITGTNATAFNMNGVSPSIVTTSTGTVSVFNTNALTANAFSAATSVTIGANSGTFTHGNPTVVGTQTTVNLWNTTSTTVNAFGAATAITIGNGTGATLTINPGTVVGSNTTQAVFNTVATTVNAFGAATSLTMGAATGTATINNATVTLANATAVNVNGVSPTIASTSTGTLTLFNTNLVTVNAFGAATAITLGNATGATLTVNPGTVVGANTTQNVFNTVATTGNLFGAGTTISIGAATGTTTINNANTVVTGDLAVNGGDITTNQTTFNLLNTTVTTGNLFGAGTTISIGAATGTTTINNANTVVTGDLAVNGADITTTTTGTATLFNTNATTLNIGSAATAVSIGASTGTTTINTPQLRIGGSDTGNFISFRGTTGDSPGTFNHTYIGERIHTASESSELLIFKGNDPAATSGPDRVRVFAGEFRVDTYTSAVTDTFEATGASASALNRLLITSDGNVTISQDLAINGGDLTTTATTFNLLNATATTVNFAGAATDVQIGAATGTTNVNNNLDVDGDVNIDGGDLTVSTTTFNLANTTATTGNLFGAGTAVSIGAATGTLTIGMPTITGTTATTFNMNGASPSVVTSSTGTASVFNTNALTGNLFGAATAVNIGAATGTLTVGNPTLTMTQGVAVNMNGVNPVIASTNTGTASLFNSNITAINFGHAAAISMGATTLNTTVRGNFLVDGNTTLGDASADLVTFNANTANVPNSLTFTIEDAVANNVSYPVAIRHTTSGTAANSIGVGLQFVTETAAGVNRAGVNLDAVATSAANGAENFSFIIDTMTAGGTAAQALLVNNNTVTVGASSTATTVNTQLSSNLTVTTGAAGVTSTGGTVTIQGGVGGSTSGAGGAISIFGGEAATSGTGGTATFRAGNATGTNIIGADTLIDAGQGTGTGRSGQIVFRTGPGGASGAVRNPLTTVLTLTSGGLEIPGNLTVGGNFTINGITTTVNSNTLTVDDKNIELGAVGSANFNVTATITAGSALITNLSSTANIIPGSAIVSASGVGTVGIPAGLRVVSVDSATQITVNQTLTGSGLANGAILTFSGATDFTADGGGITLRGATDKTFNWVSSTGHWTSNVNVSAPSLVSTVATGTAPFTVASTTKVSNLNADLLDGLDVHTGTNNEVNKIVRTDSNGYIQAGWINTSSGDNGTTAIDRVYASSDGYIRYYTPTNFRTVLNVPTRTGGDASGTWAISISGNAATATTAAAVVNTVAGTGSVELVRGNMGDNDQARILVGATASNSGYLEIATADDGTEPIHVRQYTGVFTTLTRTATLLGSDGNTSFPGSVTANGVTLTGNLGTVTSVATSGTVSGLTLTGGTITTSGTITLGGTLAVTASNFASQTANTFLAAPNGAAGVPTFRTIVAADVPTLNQNTTGSATFLTSGNYINQAGTQTSWNLDFQNTPAGATKYGGDVGANTVNGPGGSWWIQQNFRHTNASNYWGTQVAWGWEDNANKLATRNVTGGIYGAWVYYLNSSNVGSYAVTSIVAGGGITVSGTTGAVTVSHADTSSQASVDNSNGTVIQDVTLDTYGHVTALASVDLDLRYLGISSKAADSQLLDGYDSIQYQGPASAVKTFYWAIPQSGNQAKQFEIARVAVDFNDWNSVGAIEIELLEKYYGSGLKKKYTVSYGSGPTSTLRLVEYIGIGPNNFRVTVGASVTGTGDQRWIPIYVETTAYAQCDVRLTTNWSQTATNPPPIGTMFIISSPGAGTNISAFTPDSVPELTSASSATINGATILTSFAEADTLATVTGRGASTATTVTLTGGGRFSAPNDEFFSFTNVDSDSTHYTSRVGRLLTSNGANWASDGRDAVIAITRNNAGTTRGQSIGLTLHNENNTTNAYSPAITFTAVSNSGGYNSMYAAIMGKKTGQNLGVDSNWNKGELHFYAVGDAYVADTPNMVITGTAIGMNTASPAARLHVVASAATGIGSVPAGTTSILDSSSNNYLLFRNSADNGTYSGIAMQDNNMGGYVVFGNAGAGGGGDQLYAAGYGGGNLQAGTSDSINPAARTTYLTWSANGVGITSGPLTLNSNRLYFAAVNDNNHAFNYPGGTFNGQTNGTQFRWYQYLNLFSTAGGISVMHMNDSGNVGVGTTTPTFKLQVVGSFAATTKSFLIDHPTKPGMKLRYGSLEGPENGVYVRGKLIDTDIIELPDYWTGLVHADSITVNLTASGPGQQLYVERVENNCVYIVNETGKPVNCFYTVYGERKDVDKLEVEID